MVSRSDDIRELPGGIIVDRVLEDGTTLYSAWEASTRTSRHETTRGLQGHAYGRVDTKAHPNPRGLPDKPGPRTEALVSWQQAQRARAYELIGRAFPEAREGMRSRGQIRVIGTPQKKTRTKAR